MPSIRALRHLSPTLAACALALAAGTISGASLAHPPPSPPGHGGDPVGPGLYHLAGTDPALPQDDLEPLRAIVGNARYVGMGESVHTSGGFYEMKHRLFRFLVGEMGFRVLAMETPWIAAERVSTYVETCEGTPEEALNGVFSVFRSGETAALLQWMCDWNTTHPNDRVHFHGIDIQRQAKDDAEALIGFLHGLGVADDHPWISGVRECDGVVDTFYPFQSFPADRYEACQSALDAVEGYFDAEESAIRHATSREALGWARIHLMGERAGQRFQYAIPTDPLAAFATRDSGMAAVLQSIHDLRHPHARTAIWAHNGHLIDNSTDPLDYVGTGTILSEALGDHYRVIGLAAHVANVNWPAVGLCGPVDLGGENPVEDALHALGLGSLIVDMSPRGSFASFIDPAVEYSVGDFYLSSLPGNYDALVYLEESRKMSSLAWPACQ